MILINRFLLATLINNHHLYHINKHILGWEGRTIPPYYLTSLHCSLFSQPEHLSMAMHHGPLPGHSIFTTRAHTAWLTQGLGLTAPLTWAVSTRAICAHTNKVVYLHLPLTQTIPSPHHTGSPTQKGWECCFMVLINCAYYPKIFVSYLWYMCSSFRRNQN